jgi:hypothetical protein
MQRMYSPGVLQCLATAGDPAEPPEAEHAPLFLPSGLSPLQATPRSLYPTLRLLKPDFVTLTDLVLGHPDIYSNLLELQHTIMYFTTLRRHLTRANAGLSS